MKENFIPYELAKKLEEKGFPMPTNVFYAAYDDEKTICLKKIQWNTPGIESIAPSIEQVLKWLRNEKKIFINVDVRTNLEWYYEVWNINEKLSVLGNVPFNNSESYEEAAIAGITYIVDNLL